MQSGRATRAISLTRIALVAFLAAIGILFVIAGGPGVSGAAELSAITIPHPTEGREQCVQCHAKGSAQAAPEDHSGRTDETCLSCHQTPSKTAATLPPAAASPSSPSTGRAGVPTDAACMSCHQAKVPVPFASGEILAATVDIAALGSSVHATISCTACHADKTAGYPHPKPAAADIRSYALESAARCDSCHRDQADKVADSVHGQARQNGDVKAATCTDCHGIHGVAESSRLERKPQLCVSCHSIVTSTYQESVHGQLLTSGRADAASCLDCHTRDQSGHSLFSVANQEGPTADKNVPDTCGKCHHQALQTYNTTFHGRAMRLGTSGTAPNCVDCHGAYGVQRVHATEAPVDETRFASACAKCHQGAGENFASGWMGHEEASPTWFPAVFFTERFLFFLTTSVVAFGILHVELDLLRWLVRRRRGPTGGGKEEK